MKIGDKVNARYKDAIGHVTVYETKIVAQGRGGYDWMCEVLGLHIGFKEGDLQPVEQENERIP